MMLSEYLKSIADAIRAKKGTTGTIKPENFASEIEGIITSGGGGLTDRQTFTITRSLFKVTTTSSVTSVTEGSSYSEVFFTVSQTPPDEVYVKMNGVQIPTDLVVDLSEVGVVRVSIPYVTGNIFIYIEGVIA